MSAKKNPSGIKRVWPLSEPEMVRVRELYAEHVEACRALGILPEHFDEFQQDWEATPADTRQADLWPEPVDEDMRELYTARYRAYETPRAGWGL